MGRLRLVVGSSAYFISICKRAPHERSAQGGVCLRKELGGAALVRGLLIFQSCQTATDKVAKSEASAVADGAHMVGVGAVEHASRGIADGVKPLLSQLIQFCKSCELEG